MSNWPKDYELLAHNTLPPSAHVMILHESKPSWQWLWIVMLISITCLGATAWAVWSLL